MKCAICGKPVERVKPCEYYRRRGEATCDDCCEECYTTEPFPCRDHDHRQAEKEVSTDMKQFQKSGFDYYLAGPARRAVRAVRRRLRKIGDRLARLLTGKWYCAGCECYHHGRVIAFSLDDWLGDPVCGLHLDPSMLEKYEFRIGNRGSRQMPESEIEVVRNEVLDEIRRYSLERAREI